MSENNHINTGGFSRHGFATDEERVAYYSQGLKGKKTTGRKRLEDALQKSQIEWFKKQYPDLRLLLFRVKNENNAVAKIDEKTGRRYSPSGNVNKMLGVVSGVGDLCLSVSAYGYSALYCENKKPGGTQSDRQKYWERITIAAGNKYVVCDDLNDFIKIINEYVSGISDTTMYCIRQAMKEIESLEEIESVKNFKKVMK